MNHYLFFSFIASIISVYWWLWVFYKYKNLSGLFFLFYTISGAAWIIIYFLFFSGIPFSIEHRLLLSRIDYGISPLVLLCFLVFLYFFGEKNTDNSIIRSLLHEKRFMISTFILFIIIFYISGFTDTVVQAIEYDSTQAVFREIFWELSWINNLIYIAFVPISLVLFLYKKSRLSYIDNIRISKIIWVKLIFLTILIVLQWILPLYNIWILENEIVFLFVVPVIFIANIIQRYYFSPIWYQTRRLIMLLFSLLSASFIIWNIMDIIHLPESIFTNDFSSFIFILCYAGLVVFINYIINIFLFQIVTKNTSQYKIEAKMKILKKNMLQFLSYKSLEEFIEKELYQIFATKEIDLVRLTTVEINSFTTLFAKMEYKALIDDMVFLEENQIAFDFQNIWTNLKEPFIAIPIHTRGEVFGLLILWRKRFGDFYTTLEIIFLEDLASILAIHMQYIDVYNQLEDISHNLDRKVDDKTIEYNALISRQKDFIATLSHEIKAPLSSAILQIDSLSSEIEEAKISDVGIQEEIVSIWDTLVHTKTLLSQLFSTERLERRDTILYPERINIAELTHVQFDIYKRVHPDCTFIGDIKEKPLFINLDKTQFLQVLANLFGNAIKFANPKKPQVYVEVSLQERYAMIAIEDNGIDNEGINPDEIFEKYTIGKNSVWLGIWLYLCKKIVELHEWTILAKKWERLPWIRIEIYLPLL